MNNSIVTEKDLFPYRPIPFYFITTTDPKELTYEKFYESLSDMKAKGFGGVIPFNRPPHGFTQEQYFSEFWFETIGNILRACRDLGMRVWLQDDFVAPSGNMGGKLKKLAPHLVPYKLVLKDGKVETQEVPWGFPAFENPKVRLCSRSMFTRNTKNVLVNTSVQQLSVCSRTPTQDV